MASRKEQKEQARQARLEAEQADADAHARRLRLRMIGGVAIAAVAVVAVLVAISVGGGKSGGLQTGHEATALYAQVNDVIGGIPQDGTTLGDPKAKYTLTFFGDLQCPVCRAFATGATIEGVTGGFPQFVQQQVRTGHAKILYRSSCTATCNDYADGTTIFAQQQVAAYAAGMQNRFWQYAELFYRQQSTEGSGYVTSSFLDKIGAQIPGLDLTRWQTDRTDPTLLGKVEADQSAAKGYASDGITGTPGLLMSGPKGSTVIGTGMLPYSQLVAAMKAVT